MEYIVYYNELKRRSMKIEADGEQDAWDTALETLDEKYAEIEDAEYELKEVCNGYSE